jgi:hypothetical protein
VSAASTRAASSRSLAVPESDVSVATMCMSATAPNRSLMARKRSANVSALRGELHHMTLSASITTRVPVMVPIFLADNERHSTTARVPYVGRDHGLGQSGRSGISCESLRMTQL